MHFVYITPQYNL